MCVKKFSATRRLKKKKNFYFFLPKLPLRKTFHLSAPPHDIRQTLEDLVCVRGQGAPTKNKFYPPSLYKKKKALALTNWIA